MGFSQSSPPKKIKAVLAQKTGDQTIPNNTLTNLTWDDERYDPDGWHDNVTDNSQFVVPGGVDHLIALVGLSTNQVSPAHVGLYVKINGTGYAYQNQGNNQNIMLVSPPIPVVEGDVVEFAYWHTFGSSLNVQAGSTGTKSTWAGIIGWKS